jgi:hypothetical protein
MPHVPEWSERIYHPKHSVIPPWIWRPVTREGKTGGLFWGVFGNDDRQVYYPSGYPWHCVGRIFAWNDLNASSPSWWGSGVLIGPRVVLTAGHIVPWDGTTWGMQFVPAYYDGNSLIGAGTTSWVSDAVGWDTSFRSRMPNSQDIAVLRLFEPLGTALGYFGAKTYSPSWNNQGSFYLMGYPAAIANADRPSYEMGIPVLNVNQSGNFSEIEHHGDNTGGDSGGPFWAFWPDGFPYAVGTNSGGESSASEDNNVAAGGGAMADLINQARTDWP